MRLITKRYWRTLNQWNEGYVSVITMKYSLWNVRRCIFAVGGLVEVYLIGCRVRKWKLPLCANPNSSSAFPKHGVLNTTSINNNNKSSTIESPIIQFITIVSIVHSRRNKAFYSNVPLITSQNMCEPVTVG